MSEMLEAPSPLWANDPAAVAGTLCVCLLRAAWQLHASHLPRANPRDEVCKETEIRGTLLQWLREAKYLDAWKHISVIQKGEEEQAKGNLGSERMF